MFLPDMLRELVVLEQMSSGGVGVADEGESAVAVGDDRAAGVEGVDDAVGLAGDEVDGTGSGGAEVGAERVVVHGIVLGVVPEGGDGAAVVVTHGEAGGGGDGGGSGGGGHGGAIGAADGHGEEVHLAVVVGGLLVGVAVVLVGGNGLGTGEAEGVAGAAP